MRIVIAIAMIAAVAPPLVAQRGIFRTKTEVVAISTSVKKGNSPVANLKSADFRLYDTDVV